MKIPEILSSMKVAQPKLFTKLTDTEAKQFAMGLFAEVGRMVDSAQEGPVAIPNLGRFKVKQVAVKDAPQTKLRRITFIRAKAIAGKGKKKAA